MATHSITKSYRDSSGNAITATISATADGEKNYDATLGVVADLNVVLTATQANLKMVCLYADKACTVCTNAIHGGGPQDDIELTAGDAKIWSLAADGLAACPFTGNVTGFYITTSEATTIKIRILEDVTP